MGKLPQRGGWYPKPRRDGDPDGWEDKKRDPSKEPQPSKEHVGKHRDDGYPLGKRNP